ncbi:MAG: replicative DNA helicase [Gammaproteobacteria bacterium WSBS_2016_MAG_OTU1]
MSPYVPPLTVVPAGSSETPVLPHATAAEQALLGALLNNGDLWADIEDKLTAEYFYDKRHQLIFGVIQKLSATHYADWVLLLQELKSMDKLREAGGEEYIADLAGIAVSGVNVPSYAEQIRKTAQLRRMLALMHSSNARAMYPGEMSPQEILDETEAHLSDIGSQFDSGQGSMSFVPEIARGFFDIMTDIVDKKDFARLEGLKTGYSKLDKMTNGLHGGDLIIIAGRPGSGKTAFALNIVRHVSVSGEGVVVFSLEMSASQLVMRLISQDSVDMQKLRTGKDFKGRPMDGMDLRNFSKSVSALEKRNIYIDDSGTLNILEIKSRARRMAKKLKREGTKLSLIVVDYLQLLSAMTGNGNDNRAMEVAAISRGLKALARELNVPVVAGSQLNRGIESRPNKEPMLSDLRESGSIEQDADVVMFLYEEKNEQGYTSPTEPATVKLIIGKHRNGPMGQLTLSFDKPHSRFVEAAESGDSGHHSDSNTSF